jgi:hypothetical protein
MAKGLFDTTWPNYDNTFGSSSEIRKLGDILNHAKAYVKASGYGLADLRQELLIYNLLGDPTLEVKSKKPIEIFIPEIYWMEKYIKIPIIFEEPPCLQCPPIMFVALVKDEKLGKRVIGRTLLKGENFKEKVTVKLQLTENVKPENVEVVISGNEISTKVKTFSKPVIIVK